MISQPFKALRPNRLLPAAVRPTDRLLLSAVLILLGWGLLMVYSSSSALGLARTGDDLFYVQSQIYRALLGVGVMIALSRLDVRFLTGRVAWIQWGSLMFLLLVMLMPWGPVEEVRGARRWLQVGGAGVQPSEFARLGMILLLAAHLARHRHTLGTWRGLLPPVGIVVVTTFLIAAEPHMSLGLLTAAGGFLLIFLAGASIWRLALVGLTGLAAVVGIALLKGGGYHMARWGSFLAGADGALAYQAEQSVMAIGSGGLIGRGLGGGMQKYFFLPDPHTDFILSIIVEEQGFIGLFVLFLLIGFILWRIFLLGSRCGSPFGEMICYGVGVQMLLAFLLHAAVCMGWAPTTGVPFPLISFGGSALVANLTGLGLVLSVAGRSDSTLRPRGGGGAVVVNEPVYWGARR